MCFFLCNHTSHNGDIPMSSHTLLQLDYRKETVSIKNWAMIHLLQSYRSVYFKVSKESTNDSALNPLKTSGMVVDADHFLVLWRQHALGPQSNWFARYHIWSHFNCFFTSKAKRGGIALHDEKAAQKNSIL